MSDCLTTGHGRSRRRQRRDHDNVLSSTKPALILHDNPHPGLHILPMVSVSQVAWVQCY